MPNVHDDQFWAELRLDRARLAALEATAATAKMLSGTFTPTLANMAIGTGGNARNTADYTYVGLDPGTGLLIVQGIIIFGTSGATLPGNPITASLPTGYTQTTVISHPLGVIDHPLGRWSERTANAQEGSVWAQSGGAVVRFVAENVAGTYPVPQSTSSTVPETWAAGSSIVYQYAMRATKA